LSGEMQTVAACDKCGRGYCWVSDETRAFKCMDSRCGGRIQMLAHPESMDDDKATRKQRLLRMQAGGYLRGSAMVADI
jgi:hypothetical protein